MKKTWYNVPPFLDPESVPFRMDYLVIVSKINIHLFQQVSFFNGMMISAYYYDLVFIFNLWLVTKSGSTYPFVLTWGSSCCTFLCLPHTNLPRQFIFSFLIIPMKSGCLNFSLKSCFAGTGVASTSGKFVASSFWEDEFLAQKMLQSLASILSNRMWGRGWDMVNCNLS